MCKARRAPRFEEKGPMMQHGKTIGPRSPMDHTKGTLTKKGPQSEVQGTREPKGYM